AGGEPALDLHALVRQQERLGIQTVRVGVAVRYEQPHDGGEQGRGAHGTESARHWLSFGTSQWSISGLTRARKLTVDPRMIPSTAATGEWARKTSSAALCQSSCAPQTRTQQFSTAVLSTATWPISNPIENSGACCSRHSIHAASNAIARTPHRITGFIRKRRA